RPPSRGGARPVIFSRFDRSFPRGHTPCAILEPDPSRALGTSLAQLKRVRLTFDRGTVVLTKHDEALDLATIPGVFWDARVGVHRVPPYRCLALVAELRTKGVRLTDETTSYVRAPDGAFSGPA